MNTEFLQSPEWLRLQEATGKSVVPFGEEGFLANGIVHTLPLVGQYLYVPRGPIFENAKLQIPNVKKEISDLMTLAKQKQMRWVRIEPETEEMIEVIKQAVPYRVVRAPHDMQPREVFKIDIASLTEDELLAKMKSKTRYNIRLAEKRGVRILETRDGKHIAAFLDLITATTVRKGISAHPRDYYEQFFQTLPERMCRLFVAEYDGKIIAGNMVIFYGDTVTYLHGGTGDIHRDAMAPYLLQWEQIKTAKKEGYHFYDFGGIKSEDADSSWRGITTFKRGFAPETAPTVYAGAYDIILDAPKYLLYHTFRPLQGLKKSIIG